MSHISVAIGGNIGPFDIVMIIVEGEVLVGKIGVGVTRAPLVVHHLDVDKVGPRSAEFRLHGPDTGKSGVVIGLDEGRRRWSLGFVDELDGTGAPEVGVGVDDVGDPFEELVGTLVIVVAIESGRWCELASERLLGVLSARCTVEIDNDIETGSFGPSADTLEVLETTSGEVLAAVDEGLHNPVSNRDTDSVEPETLDLVDIVLGDPPVPMCLESSVGTRLAKSQDTIELGLSTTAPHCVPFVAHHPWFDDEKTAQVDTADFICCREPRVGHTSQE